MPGALFFLHAAHLATPRPMKRALRILLSFLVCSSAALPSARGQALLPKHEFRGAWIATVSNLDWPSSRGLSTAQQQAEMIAMLDGLQAAGINVVMFQIRPESDALYESSLEPWSYFLSGMQGVAPSPYYDPLTFTLDEAHKRGIEVHAWFNPYRVWMSARNYVRDPSHVLISKPDWMLTVNNTITVLDPGIPDVRAWVIDVIRDVVSRYDVDGIHFDDYFYPYPPNSVTNEDWGTYATYKGSFTNVDIWRTYNVNMLVRGVWEMMQAEAPDVKFGISPFGIWKSGTPPGVVGLSGATDLHADAVNWMAQGWLDYLTPQLYWAFGGSQDYGSLAPWWAEQMNGRHLYPGHGLYRSDPSTYSGTLFSSSEIPNQVRFNRDHDIPGSVFFWAENITGYWSKGFADTLKTDLYRHQALTPIMPWKDLRSPGAPTDLLASNVETEVTLSWTPPVPDGWSVAPRFYSVYRFHGVGEPDWQAVVSDPANLVAVTGDTTWVDHPGDSDDPYWYAVHAVSANSVESDTAPAASVLATGIETDLPVAFRMDAAFPNPFRGSTTVRYGLPRAGSVTIAVHDALGRQVALLVDEAVQPSAEYEVSWDAAASGVSTGTYFVVMRFDAQVRSRPVAFVR